MDKYEKTVRGLLALSAIYMHVNLEHVPTSWILECSDVAISSGVRTQRILLAGPDLSEVVSQAVSQATLPGGDNA